MGEAKTFDEKNKAVSVMDAPLSRLLLVSENHPQLKADQNFRELQVCSKALRTEYLWKGRYNEEVQKYNTAVRVLPASLVASLRLQNRLCVHRSC
jgi:LemA protein